MAVYVDDMYRYPMGRYGRMKMSHMVADTRGELLSMAREIGMTEAMIAKWLQYPGTPREHFDVPMDRRELAIAKGAVPVTMRQLARIRARNRSDFHAYTQGTAPAFSF